MKMLKITNLFKKHIALNHELWSKALKIRRGSYIDTFSACLNQRVLCFYFHLLTLFLY